MSKDEQCILVSTLASIAYLLDKETGELLQHFEGHKNIDYRMDSCLDEKDVLVFSGSEDGFAYVWDFVEGKVVRKLKHPASVVHSLSAHPTEAKLLTACLGKVYLWDNKPKPS